MKNKITILMNINTLLSTISLCVVLVALIMGFGFPGGPIYFGFSLAYISLNILLSPVIYKIYKKKKTVEMVSFTGYVSLFFTYLLFGVTIYSIVLFCSTFSFLYGPFPFIISLFLLLIVLSLFGVALFITISKFTDAKRKAKSLNQQTN